MRMAYVPKDAEWFLAQLVEEFQVQGRKRNAVHINYVLIRANTPSEAYQKALKLGRQANQTWKNPDGKRVRHRFVGLRDLDVIYEPLEHGCEIMFVERLGMSGAGLRKLIRRKEELEIFLPIRPRRGRPDYSSKEILEMPANETKGEQAAEPPGSRQRRGPTAVSKPKSVLRRA